MTARAHPAPQHGAPNPLEAGIALQEEGLRLLLAEVRALQAMIPIGERDLPGEEEMEKAFDNMPV